MNDRTANNDVDQRQHRHDALRDDRGRPCRGGVEDVADPQQAADRSQEAQKREDDSGVHRMHALAVVARKQTCHDEQETEGGGNERGQADRVGQDVATESQDDEGGAERDCVVGTTAS